MRGLGWKSLGLSMAIFVLLGVARLALRVLPFRWVAPVLGHPYRQVELSTVIDGRQTSRARRIGLLIRRVAAHTPWDSRCLAQAAVAALLLRLLDIPYVLHLGAARDGERGLRTHAWVRAGAHAVTGGDEHAEFAVVSTFIAPNVRRSILP